MFQISQEQIDELRDLRESAEVYISEGKRDEALSILNEMADALDRLSENKVE